MRELRLNFHPPSQLRKLLFRGFMKWFVTVAIMGAISGIMYYYAFNVRPMTERDKQTYNFLVLGLSLALGMNLASSLKQMATDARWWVLSLTKRNLREVDLILHLDGLTEVTKLAFVAPRLAPACFSWLLLNIVSLSSLKKTWRSLYICFDWWRIFYAYLDSALLKMSITCMNIQA
jgi:hypothetical protein